MKAAPTEEPVNVVEMPRVQVPDRRARAHRPQPQWRFKIATFTNRGGSEAWRVSGVTRTGKRIRENFNDAASARCRQTELEGEYLARAGESTTLRSTRLSEVQARIAEVVYPLLERDDDLLIAVNFWREHRHKHKTAAAAPRIDEAVKQFVEWLGSPDCDLAEHTRNGYRIRVGMFTNGVSNVSVAEINPKFISVYLTKRAEAQGPGEKTIGRTTLKNDRRAICRFLSWCVAKEWITTNPALGPRRRGGGKLHSKLPEIFTVDQCRELLKAAEDHEDGMIVPYVAVCLFAGLRPDSEAERITWKQVNLADKQISIEPGMSKTGKPRTIEISPTLLKWLAAYEGIEFYPPNWRREFAAVKKAAGIEKWIVDGMRHTSHSHYFRLCGSYGLTAEFHGNSEAIVRKNYVNRVSSAETKEFYALAPTKGRAQK